MSEFTFWSNRSVWVRIEYYGVFWLNNDKNNYTSNCLQASIHDTIRIWGATFTFSFHTFFQLSKNFFTLFDAGRRDFHSKPLQCIWNLTLYERTIRPLNLTCDQNENTDALGHVFAQWVYFHHLIKLWYCSDRFTSIFTLHYHQARFQIIEASNHSCVTDLQYQCRYLGKYLCLLGETFKKIDIVY